MIQKMRKAPKIAICRACHGTGEIYSGRLFRKTGPCPQCEGSGRVMVSCEHEVKQPGRAVYVIIDPNAPKN